MRRNRTRSPKHNTANLGNFGRLVSLGHKLVFPGETLQRHKVTARIQSAPIKPIISGAYVDLYTFYVPIRLCWDGFPEWLLDPETAEAPHKVTAPHKNLGLLQNKSFDWPLRAMELIYQNFFHMEQNPPAILETLPHPDMSFEVAAFPKAQPDGPIDISDGDLTVKEIDKARFDQARQDWLYNVGGSYPAYLQSMGVNVQDMHMMPEYLGGSRKWVYPSRTIDQSTGYSVQSYMADVSWNRDRKNAYFPEHGLLMDFVAIRPKVYFDNSTDEMGDLKPSDLLPNLYPGDVSESFDFRYMFEMSSFYAHPDVNAGTQNVAFLETVSPAYDRQAMLYPQWHTLTEASDFGGGQNFAVDGKTSSSIRTWLSDPRDVTLGADQYGTG